jgi:hypothetical protein
LFGLLLVGCKGVARLGDQRRGRRRQVHRLAVEADDADGGRARLNGLGQRGFGRGLDRGEAVQVVLLPGEPVLDRLDHGQLLTQVRANGLGVGRGQGGRLGVLEVVGLSCRFGGLLFLVLSSAEEAPGDSAAGGLAVVVVALGLGGSCLDQAVSFDIESIHVVAAGASHE